jgi:hypothetical protein
MGKESDVPTKDNPLIRALARWEWEGGSTVEPDWEKHAALIQEELKEHIARFLHSHKNV